MSHSEPFGLVLAEAMASGKPVFGLNGLGEYREAALPLITDDNSFSSGKTRRRSGARSLRRKHGGSDDVLADLASHIESKWHHGEDRERVVAAAQSWVTQRFWGTSSRRRRYQNLPSRRCSPAHIGLTGF